MKTLFVLLLCGFLFGCAGSIKRFNAMLEELPNGGFEEFTVDENIAPSVSVSLAAHGAAVVDGDLVVDSIVYDRKIGTSTGHITVKGLELYRKRKPVE